MNTDATRDRSVAEMFAPPSWPRSAAGWKSIFGAIGLTALIGLAFFLFGVVRWNSQLEMERNARRQDIQQVQAKLTRAEQVNSLLRARGDLFQSVTQLDQRHFGLANNQVKDAAAQLKRVDAGATGVDGQTLQELKQQLAVTDVQASGDVGAQRARILRFAQRLDRLIPG